MCIYELSVILSRHLERVGIIFVLNLHKAPEYQWILQGSFAVFCVFFCLFVCLCLSPGSYNCISEDTRWSPEFDGWGLAFLDLMGLWQSEKKFFIGYQPQDSTQKAAWGTSPQPHSRLSVKRAFCLSQSLSLRDRFQVWHIFSGLRSFSQGK